MGQDKHSVEDHTTLLAHQVCASCVTKADILQETVQTEVPVALPHKLKEHSALELMRTAVGTTSMPFTMITTSARKSTFLNSAATKKMRHVLAPE